MSLLYNGELDRAEDAFERAERHLEGEASPALRSKVLGQWAGVMLNRGELEAARHTLEQSIDVAGRHGLLRITAQSLNLLGDCERRLGQYERASECYRRAEQGASILRAPRLFPVWLGRIQVALEQRDYETARRQLDRAESQTRRSVFPHFDWSKTFLALEVHAGLGNLEEAERRIDELSSDLHQVETHSPDATESLARSTKLLRAQERPALADRVEQLLDSSGCPDE
jgi:ATP/maltotriose-dependent transcriptional regulator MalT